MRVLITGINGFCGRHLKAFLESQSIEVFGLPRSETRSVTLIAKYLTRIQPNFVFHLAGVSYSQNQADYYQVNCEFAANLFQAQEEANLLDRPLLLTGTSAEYGMIKGNELPITEETIPKPYNNYGISKLAQTLMGQALAKEGRPILLVRPFNIIGPGMPPHLSIQTFVSQLRKIKQLESPPVLRVGNLLSSRDFIDIQDVVEIYWKLIVNKSAYGEIINVCTGVGTQVGTLLDFLIKEFGLEVEIQQNEKQIKKTDIPIHYGSVTKLQTFLGPLSFKELKHTVKDIVSAVRGL